MSLNEKLKNKITSASFAKYSAQDTQETESRSGWVEYGRNNLYPQYLIDLYYNSPVHNALTSSIAFMIQGKGTQNILLDYCIDKIAFDLKLQGGFFAEVIWNLDYTEPAKINHLPFENCRLAYDKDTEDITGIWYSLDWANTRTKKGKPEFIPLLDKEQAKEEPRQVVYGFIPNAGSLYYSKPDYFGSLTYIELSKNIGVYHVNNILNGLFPSFIIAFNNGVPTEEAQDEIIRDLENKISGAQNSGKFWVTWNDDPLRKMDVTPFPLSDADKQYEYLDDATTRQIMIAHRVTSPLLFGIRDSSGLGNNKDEMLIALQIFMTQVIKPFQKIISDVFTPIIGSINFIQNNILEDMSETVQDLQPATTTPDATATPDTTSAPVEQKVSDVTYNGAQIASAIDIVAKVKEGILSQEQAIVFLVQFLQLDVNVAQSMFATTGNAVAQLSAVKKKVKTKSEKFSKTLINGVPTHIGDEDSTAWLSHLSDKAEYIDEDEWECISDEEVTDPKNEHLFRQEYMSLRDYSNPNEKSTEMDQGLYKIRYYYSKNLTWRGDEMVTRDFCQEMVALSKAGALYRYEDIIAMEGENEQFAPSGSSSYSIWEWKGGCYCHHKWFRKIFFRKKDKGRFLPNKGLKNDIQVQDNQDALTAKGVETVRPIDTPSRGSLKNG
jgi:hypothetical protein